MKKEKLTGLKKLLAPILSIVLVGTCAAVSLGGYEAPIYEVEAVEKVTTQSVEETTETELVKGNFDLADGVYQGTGTGFSGSVKVAVEIKDGSIVSIEVLSNSDDAAFFNRAKGVIDTILTAQSYDVDTVSGATYSSRGIINAVKNAITGEVDTSSQGDSSNTNTSKEVPDTEDIEEPSAYENGTYYGMGTGFGGTIKVKVVVKKGKIASIKIVSHSDGANYISKTSSLIKKIIKKQTTNVDCVSGATYSSVGVIEAVRDALSQAAKDSNEEEKKETDKEEDITGTVPYKEGIYYGTGEGYWGDITVAVVIQDYTIKAILVTQQEEDESFFTRAMDVVKNVLKQQNTEVDTVSGATFSSKGLLDAIKNALEEARKATEEEKGSTEASTQTTETSTETTETTTENTETTTETTETTETTNEETSVYIDGTYEGTAVCAPDQYFEFDQYNIHVKITVQSDKIVSVTDISADYDPDEGYENDTYFANAINGRGSKKGVVAQIIEKGLLEGVDTVTRATCSSKAIIEACKIALEQAKRQ